MAKLTTYVAVQDELNNVVSFGPGDEVPGWARKKITNPKVWDDYDPEAEAKPAPVAGDPPPLHGNGSGRDAWAAYATGEVDVQDDWKREDIVDALRKAGVRVE